MSHCTAKVKETEINIHKQNGWASKSKHGVVIVSCHILHNVCI